MVAHEASKDELTGEGSKAEERVDSDDESKAHTEAEAGEEQAEEERKAEKPAKTSWWRSALGSLDVSSLLSTAQTAMANPDVKNAVAKASGGKENVDTDQLLKALAAQQNATGLLQKAQNYKDQAMRALDPKERQRMMQEAYDKEVAANGQSKMARRMQSGAWQGGAGGAGAGAGVGMGLGTVVGTVVGGVVSLPTTALGGLVGAGVGGIHGPFVKLNKKKAEEVADREKAKGKSDEQIEEAVKEEASEEVTAPDAPEGIEDTEAVSGAEGVDEIPQTQTSSTTEDAAIGQSDQNSAKRNLERQQSEVPPKAQSASPKATRDPNKPRKKPRKLEVRSRTKPATASSK